MRPATYLIVNDAASDRTVESKADHFGAFRRTIGPKTGFVPDRPRCAAGIDAAQPTNEAAQAWLAVQATSSQAVLEAFIKRYGDGIYGSFARDRLEELKKSNEQLAPEDD